MIKNLTLTVFLTVILVSAGMLSGCDPDKVTTPAANALPAVWCQETANKVLNLLPSEIPQNLTNGDSVKTDLEWNANTYFDVLTHLSMEDGYVLDYVYAFDGSAGSPELYARPEEAVPFKTFDEYGKALNTYTRPENDISTVWFVMGEETGLFGNKIKIDDTKEGYYEYTVLQLLGEQFYLFWHSNYNDTRIICDAGELEGLLESIGDSGFGEPVDEDFKEQARKIDLQPTVDIGTDTVTVSLVVFSKWGGFTRLSYFMDRNYPRMVTGIESKNLLEYQCGVVF